MKRLALTLLVAVALGGPAARAAATGLSEPALWLQQYLRIDTSNPPGREAAGAAFLAGILDGAGLETRRLVTPEGRASVYARLPGREPGAILLLSHIDVVRPGEGWTLEPFGGAVVHGELEGRGAIDSKGLGIAELAAIVDLKRRGVAPKKSVIYLAVADEEAGGGQGTVWVLQQYPELFADVEAVFNEGGTNRVVDGKVLWWGVEVALKRPLWLHFEADGRAGHAASLQPHSAAHQLIEALARVLALPPRFHVSAAARQYVHALAPLHNPALAHVLSRIDEVIAPDGPKEGLLPGMASLFLDTVQVTVLHASEQINAVAARATADADVRLLPDTDAAAFLDEIRRAAGPEVAVTVLLEAPPGAASPTDSPAYRAVASVLGQGGAAIVPAFISGFTDSRYFRARGIPAYGLMPFALDGDDLRTIHGPDERIPIAELDRGVERMRRIVAAAAGE